MKEELFYPSRDGKTQIHALVWKPEEEPKAVLVLVHGMEEHIERYEPFAEYLNQYGICVAANDHLGHGQSVLSKEEYGYFGEGDIATVVVRDVHRLKKMMQERYPDKPFFLMGHSMGSFIARNYIARYGTGIMGAVIMGTGSQPAAILPFGKAVTGVIGTFKGSHHKSSFVQKLSFGSYLKRIPDAKTPVDWLSVNDANVQDYIADPLDGFGFTVNGFKTLFELIRRCQSGAYVNQVPKTLPLFFVAGAEDPVGGYGVGVKKAFRSYEAAGVKDMKLKLYPGLRHEILNEDGKEEVYGDIRAWLEEHME